ncbi:unnamed protein product [Pleuronectes platessa]|uniref:Uncharacterized protein n=1 Tax=Pleuronectes platessa TaxID=8262 RepID=A0A9N7VJE0_PLEPL|nr:unnamed protein product [Pleuronectes platessa]
MLPNMLSSPSLVLTLFTGFPSTRTSVNILLSVTHICTHLYHSLVMALPAVHIHRALFSIRYNGEFAQLSAGKHEWRPALLPWQDICCFQLAPPFLVDSSVPPCSRLAL